MCESSKRLEKNRQRERYINWTTGQNLVVTKKQYGEHYLALLFPRIREDEEGTKVSPEFPTESKANLCYGLDEQASERTGRAARAVMRPVSTVLMRLRLELLRRILQTEL